MPRLAWATDIHFEFASVDQIVAFCESIIAATPDGLLIAGDIGQAQSVERYLRALDKALPMPVYFVLGNHDYYNGSITDVRAAIAEFVTASKHLHWMPAEGVVQIGEDTGLVGHDGWADGRCGDFASSRVMLNDYRLIRELSGLTPPARLAMLNALGDEAAAHFRRVLPEALARFHTVIALTHVPPFAETSWYQGRISDPDWLPHFCARALGDVLLEVADAHPDRELLVLCGHTHGGAGVEIRPNLRVVVGAAEYGHPVMQDVIVVR
jgi:3',5'-cyclic AMP phosphodiesterase CpdA